MAIKFLPIAVVLLYATGASRAFGAEPAGPQDQGLLPVDNVPEGINPSVGAAIIYVDNVDQAPPGAPTDSEAVLQLTPQLQLRHTGPRITSALDYKMQLLRFEHRDDLNAIYHNGSANGSWQISPGRFYVDGFASYHQQVSDPSQPSNGDNLFHPGNTTNRLTLMLAPTLQHDFETTTASLRVVGAGSRYSEAHHSSVPSTLQDSNTRLVAANFGTRDAGAAYTWAFNATSSRTVFDVAAPFEDDQASVDGSARLYEALSLVATGGVETNILKNSESGGLNSGYWLVGLRWTPSERDTVDLRVGHRFFGTAYSASWSHQSSQVLFTGSYSETPTTTGQADTLVSFTPGQLPITPEAYATVLRSSDSYSPYLNRNANAGIELQGTRTHVNLNLYYMRRTYLDTILLGRKDSSRGGILQFTRDVGPRTKAGLAVDMYSTQSLNTPDSRDYRYELFLKRQVTSSFNMSLQAVRLLRSGFLPYHAKLGMLSVQKAF